VTPVMMRQAVHIFAKDVRHLRVEIALVLLLAVAHASAGAVGLADWRSLLVVAAVFLIVRLVHAEAIPGDTQFWLTRPYRWSSLLTAKLMVVLAFVAIPVNAAQLAIFVRDGFAVSENIVPIAWSSMLVFAVLILPAIALGAITRNIVHMVAVAIVLGFAWFVLDLRIFGDVPYPIEWIRDSLVGVTLAGTAGVVIIVQYRFRKTTLARVTAIVGLAAGFLFHQALPVRALAAVQSALGAGAAELSSLVLELDPPEITGVDPPYRVEEPVRVRVPVHLEGVPSGIELQSVYFRYTVREADSSALIASGRSSADDPSGGFRLSTEEFDRLRGQAVRVEAEAFVTGFGDVRTFDYEPAVTPSRIDRLECRIDGGAIINTNEGLMEVDHLQCRTPARWPALRLLATADGELFRRTAVSYSPFPSGLDLNAYGGAGANVPRGLERLSVRLDRPVGHIRLSAERTFALGSAVGEAP